MRRRPQQRLRQVREPRCDDREQPGMPRAELPSREVTEPDAGAEIRNEMPRIHVQRERRPRAPPFAGLHARGIHGTELERIQPPEPAGNGVADDEEREGVEGRPHPGEWMKRRRRRGRRRGPAFQRISRQMSTRGGMLGLIHHQHVLQPIEPRGGIDLTRNADRGEHERALLALRPAPGPEHFDEHDDRAHFFSLTRKGAPGNRKGPLRERPVAEQGRLVKPPTDAAAAKGEAQAPVFKRVPVQAHRRAQCQPRGAGLSCAESGNGLPWRLPGWWSPLIPLRHPLPGRSRVARVPRIFRAAHACRRNGKTSIPIRS